MDAKTLLEQFLNSGRELADKGVNIAEGKLGIPAEGQERDAMVSGATKGAVAAGALALLLGTDTGRKITSNALKLGSLAAVASVAYKAWQNIQSKKNDTQQTTPQQESVIIAGSLTGPNTDERSLILLKAMIAAAKSDGHIDDKERDRINQQFDQLGLDPNAAKFIHEEISKPLDPTEIANLSQSAEQAAEIYLVSRLVIDANNIMEKKYLQLLAKQLALPDELIAHLETQVNAQT